MAYLVRAIGSSDSFYSATGADRASDVAACKPQHVADAEAWLASHTLEEAVQRAVAGAGAALADATTSQLRLDKINVINQ
jgi:hypothetical protein